MKRNKKKHLTVRELYLKLTEELEKIDNSYFNNLIDYQLEHNSSFRKRWIENWERLLNKYYEK